MKVSADESKMAESKADSSRQAGQLESKTTEAKDGPLTPPE